MSASEASTAKSTQHIQSNGSSRDSDLVGEIEELEEKLAAAHEQIAAAHEQLAERDLALDTHQRLLKSLADLDTFRQQEAAQWRSEAQRLAALVQELASPATEERER